MGMDSLKIKQKLERAGVSQEAATAPPRGA